MPPPYRVRPTVNAFVPYTTHEAAVRSALRRAGIASAEIDRITAEESANIQFSGQVTYIITEPGLVRVQLVGWISTRAGVENDIELHFPPNEAEYLAECKRAQDNIKYLSGDCFLGSSTNLLLLKRLSVISIASKPVEIVEVSTDALAALRGNAG